MVSLSLALVVGVVAMMLIQVSVLVFSVFFWVAELLYLMVVDVSGFRWCVVVDRKWADAHTL